jgi:hypothetical protein
MLLRFTSQSPSGLKPDERLKQGLAPRVGSLLRASRLEKQNFGSLLGETVQKTSITLLTIGGFITIFSVLIGIMEAAGFFNALITALAPVAQLFHVDVSLLRALMYGLFEITIGINEASKSSGSFIQQLLVIEVLLAWNGLAVQAQVAGMMVGSDLRLWLYLLTRCLQVPIAVLIAYMVTLLPVRDYLTHPALATGPAASWFPWVSGLCVPAGIVLALFTGYTLNKWWVQLFPAPADHDQVLLEACLQVAHDVIGVQCGVVPDLMGYPPALGHNLFSSRLGALDDLALLDHALDPPVGLCQDALHLYPGVLHQVFPVLDHQLGLAELLRKQ